MLVVDIILFGVLEDLIGSKLFLDHALKDTIVGELCLELEEALADLPFVLRIGELCKSSHIRLLGSLLSVVSLVLFRSVALLTSSHEDFDLLLGIRVVKQVDLADILVELDVVLREGHRSLSLRFVHELLVQDQSYDELLAGEEVADELLGITVSERLLERRHVVEVHLDHLVGVVSGLVELALGQFAKTRHVLEAVNLGLGMLGEINVIIVFPGHRVSHHLLDGHLCVGPRFNGGTYSRFLDLRRGTKEVDLEHEVSGFIVLLEQLLCELLLHLGLHLDFTLLLSHLLFLEVLLKSHRNIKLVAKFKLVVLLVNEVVAEDEGFTTGLWNCRS